MPSPRSQHPSGVKVCSKCFEWLPLDRYNFRSRARGVLRSQCKGCDATEKARYLATPAGAAKAREFKLRNRPIERAQDRARRAARPERARESERRYRSKDTAKARRREYLARPEVRERVNALRRARQPRVYRQSVTLQLNVRMACLIRRSLKTGKNSRSWRSLVDYDIAELRAHLERQFTDGMDWAAFLRGEIHIDHIRPLSGFSYTDANDPQFMACWGLGNLRPLWARENHRKRNRMEFLV